MIKVMSIMGTRPEGTKMAPLVKKLEADSRFESIVCSTGQHKEQLEMVFDLFDIKPDYDLGIMKHGQTIIDIMSKSMYGLDEVIKKVKPHIVLVHGDTSTSCIGAQVAFLNKVPVGHVEAGLRTFDKYSPFPEEMNRRLIAPIADIHFAATEVNVKNLKGEGIRENIYVTGNTAIDGVSMVIEDGYKFEDPRLASLDFENKKVIAMTCHRRENWGQPMEDIFDAVRQVADMNEDIEIVYGVHLNPMIGKLAEEKLGGHDRIHLIPAIDYKPFANLMKKSYFVLTDSGGIQEEAPSFDKPVLVMRTETERVEAAEAGTVKMLGVNKENIIKEMNNLLNNEEEYTKMTKAKNPYGDGNACGKIVDALYGFMSK